MRTTDNTDTTNSTGSVTDEYAMPDVEQVTIPAETGPLSYLTGDLIVDAYFEFLPTLGYTADGLTAMAEECGSEHVDGYFENLIKTYEGISPMQYSFIYQGESQDSGIYNVTLLPNLMNYKTMEEFGADFRICAAGGGGYPYMLNDEWLVFTGSCGSGYDDGSGLPHGCQEVLDVVKPSLSFK